MKVAVSLSVAGIMWLIMLILLAVAPVLVAHGFDLGFFIGLALTGDL